MYMEFEKVIRTEELVNLENIVESISGRSVLENVVEEVQQQLMKLENRFSLVDFRELQEKVYSDVAERFYITASEESNLVIVPDVYIANEKSFLEHILPKLLKSINNRLNKGVERIFIDFKAGITPIEITTSEGAEEKLKEVYNKFNYWK